MKLVPEAKHWWSMYSTKITAILAALAVLEGVFSTFSYLIPPTLMPWFVAFFAGAAFVGRLIDQPEIKALDEKV